MEQIHRVKRLFACKNEKCQKKLTTINSQTRGICSKCQQIQWDRKKCPMSSCLKKIHKDKKYCSAHLPRLNLAKKRLENNLAAKDSFQHRCCYPKCHKPFQYTVIKKYRLCKIHAIPMITMRYARKDKKRTDHSKEYAARKQRFKENPLLKVAQNIRSRLSMFLRGRQKNQSLKQYLGCDLEMLKKYLQKQFKPGMTWENYGKWHIDHKIPLTSATSENEVYKLNHYTNLQPLWAAENISKGGIRRKKNA